MKSNREGDGKSSADPMNSFDYSGEGRKWGSGRSKENGNREKTDFHAIRVKSLPWTRGIIEEIPLAYQLRIVDRHREVMA